MAALAEAADLLAGDTNPDLAALRQLWLNERMAPELLPYDTDLIDRIREIVSYQVLKSSPTSPLSISSL